MSDLVFSHAGAVEDEVWIEVDDSFETNRGPRAAVREILELARAPDPCPDAAPAVMVGTAGAREPPAVLTRLFVSTVAPPRIDPRAAC